MSGRPFVILGVNTDDRDAYEKGQRQLPVPWRSFADGSTNGPICRRWCVGGFPSSWLMDHEGVIRHRNLSGAALEKAVRELVTAAEGTASRR
jgi:hypothetical protein